MSQNTMRYTTAERNEYQRRRAWELSSLSVNLKLMTTLELFYGENESTYVMKKTDQKAAKLRPELTLAAMPFYPDAVEEKEEKEEKKGDEKKKDPDVVLWVPMCCNPCEERIIVPVSEMKGVKSVDCNWYKKKVVVSGKELNEIAILLKCQTIFCKAALWKD